MRESRLSEAYNLHQYGVHYSKLRSQMNLALWAIILIVLNIIIITIVHLIIIIIIIIIINKIDNQSLVFDYWRSTCFFCEDLPSLDSTACNARPSDVRDLFICIDSARATPSTPVSLTFSLPARSTSCKIVFVVASFWPLCSWQWIVNTEWLREDASFIRCARVIRLELPEPMIFIASKADRISVLTIPDTSWEWFFLTILRGWRRCLCVPWRSYNLLQYICTYETQILDLYQFFLCKTRNNCSSILGKMPLLWPSPSPVIVWVLPLPNRRSNSSEERWRKASSQNWSISSSLGCDLCYWWWDTCNWTSPSYASSYVKFEGIRPKILP